MKKSWREKMNPSAKYRLVRLEKPFMGVAAGSKMLVATPNIVRDYIRHIPHGQTRTVPEMRKDLARAFKVNTTCPTSSGIFVRINAEAALEDLRDGKPLGKITPFWRIIDPASLAAKKLSCGPEFIEERRRAELSVSGKLR